MNNTTATSASTYTLTGTTIGGSPYCPSHGYNSCNCLSSNNPVVNAVCSLCGGVYYANGQHVCINGGTIRPTLTWCGVCNQNYMGGHICVGSTIGNIPYTTYNTWTTTGINWQPSPTFKDVKEITTDSELTYEWNGGSFNMILPLKFSDCFLKVGYTWSPLYPLIFSALENDSKEMSFHLVIGITDKTFEGDKVILKSVTTTKVEDNLTLVQLIKQTRSFFKEDK